MFCKWTEESYSFWAGLFISEYQCNPFLMLFLTWIGLIDPFTLPPSCSKQKQNSWLPNINKGQKKQPLFYPCGKFEIIPQPTFLNTDWQHCHCCLCDSSLICHHYVFPTGINVYSSRKTTTPVPVCPYPPWEGDTSSLLPGSAHSFPYLIRLPNAPHSPQYTTSLNGA